MNKFVGKYVEDIAAALIAASVSGLHINLIGPPGCGKTAIAKSFMDDVFGEAGVLTRFNPTTSPSKVEGQLDYAALFGLDGGKPEWRIISDGTPYSPSCRMWLADELFRCNEAVQDMMIDVLDRWDVDRTTAPIVVGTNNFIPAKSERAKAVLDRFGMTMFVESPSNGLKDIVKAQIASNGRNLSVPGDLPTLETINDIHRAVPTERAMDVVADFLEDFKKSVDAGLKDDSGIVVRSFDGVNNRRLTYWAILLSKVTIYYTGLADFDKVHKKAVEALKYAWSPRTKDEYDDWGRMAALSADPIGAIVEQALTQAYAQMKDVSANTSDRIKRVTEIGKIIQGTLDNLKEFADVTSDEYLGAKAGLETMFAELVRGQ